MKNEADNELMTLRLVFHATIRGERDRVCSRRCASIAGETLGTANSFPDTKENFANTNLLKLNGGTFRPSIRARLTISQS